MGSARNIAENLARLGNRVHLVSVVGATRWARTCSPRPPPPASGVEHVARTDRPTGTYTAVLDVDGELIVAIADMDATAELGPDHLQAARDVIATAGVLVLDGNLATRRAGARAGPVRRRAHDLRAGQRAQGAPA